MYKFITLILIILTSGTPSLPTPAVAAPVAAEEGIGSYRSRSDLRPPVIEITTPARGTAPGYIFIAPKQGDEQAGPMIVDNHGEAVWFLSRTGKKAADFRVQQYRGEPVLTWWEGDHDQKGIGYGELVIADSSYREIARFGAGNGYRADLHEFLITSRDTALIMMYGVEDQDLSSVDGSKEGKAYEGVVQELDIETGRVLFEWHSLEDVGVNEACVELPKNRKQPFDYFHINSIDIDEDGNLLVSARNTCAVYKIDTKTGEVIWRLGGKRSDFKMGQDTRFAYQHDARWQSDGTITMFDNAGAPFVRNQSRGMVLRLDMDAMTATLEREYTHPNKIRSPHQANMQVLPNGNVFIGWGGAPFFSEFDKGGTLLFQGRLPKGRDSYRAYRFGWTGHPTDDPAVAVEPNSGDQMTVYASWNGATEVATWQVLAGPSADQLQSVESAPRDGFETDISVRTTEPYIAVQALDASGEVLGTSKTVPVVGLPATGGGGGDTAQSAATLLEHNLGVVGVVLVFGVVFAVRIRRV